MAERLHGARVTCNIHAVTSCTQDEITRHTCLLQRAGDVPVLSWRKGYCCWMQAKPKRVTLHSMLVCRAPGVL